MNKHETILLSLDDLLELDPGTLKGSEELKDIEAWDSLAVMGFIAMVDEEFDVMVPPAQLSKCKTVADLISLVEDHTES
jgi:acyl carrier protein